MWERVGEGSENVEGEEIGDRESPTGIKRGNEEIALAPFLVRKRRTEEKGNLNQLITPFSVL